MTWPELKQKIQSKMEAEEITAYRLSKLTGIPQSTLSLYFNDKREPQLNNILLILDVLGFKIN